MATDNNIQTNGGNAPVAKENFVAFGDEITEVISARPPFLVRWGILLLFLVLLSAAAVSWFIKYPDVVGVHAKLVSINAPKPVTVLQTGKLVSLLVKEGDSVLQNQPIAFAEAVAKHEDVLKLCPLIDSLQLYIDNGNMQLIAPLLQHSNMQLGELQNQFQIFNTAWLSFKNYLQNGFYLRKKIMLNTDMLNLAKMKQNLLRQQNILQQDLKLTQQTFNANESLKNDSVISAFDYRNEKSKLLNKKLTLPQITASILSTESQQNEKLKEIAELDNTIAQQKNIFQQALHTLKSNADEWKRKYILTAPVNGKITFTSFIQENQQLAAGQTICFVNSGNSQYYAQAVIPQYNFGKILQGQKVLIKFAAYPYQEFGAVSGSLQFVSNMATDSGYLSKIELPNGLETNFKKTIQFKEGLTATAEIITKDMRLLERFYNSVFYQR